MTSDLKGTIEAIHARGYLQLTDSERATLDAAPKGHWTAVKLLAVDDFNRRDFLRAIPRFEALLTNDPSAENFGNLVAALTRALRFDDAIEMLRRDDCPLPEIKRISWLGECYSAKNDPARAKDCGLRALQLKDEDILALDARPEPILHKFDPHQPQRNVIAFSLFGDAGRYTQGAIKNAAIAPYLYPGWTVRFYIDERVPEDAVHSLVKMGAQIIRVNGMPVEKFGLFWRFLVEDDPNVAIYLVRDADSVMNIKERVAVQQWLESGLPFHVIRDSWNHSELVLAGMWGAHRGNIGNVTKRILAFKANRAKIINDRTDDQLFLRAEIWPLMRERACVHDPVFSYGATHKTPDGFDLPGTMHIGQNDIERL